MITPNYNRPVQQQSMVGSSSFSSQAPIVPHGQRLPPAPQLVQTTKHLEIVKSSWGSVLQNKHTLLIAPKPEKITELKMGLQAYCDERDKKFLYINLSYPHQIPSQSVATQIFNSIIKRSLGLWMEIMQNGGVVLLNYEFANSKLVEHLNCLFDTPQRYDGKPTHPDLRIVGAMSGEKIAENPSSYSTAVFSRWFPQAEPGEALYQPDPIEKIQSISIEEQAKLPRFDFLDPKQFLIGKPKPSRAEGVVALKGELLHALQGGHKSFVLANCDWTDEEFRDTLHRIFAKQFKFNGECYQLPENFVFYRFEDPIESFHTYLSSHTFEVATRARSGPVLVVNQGSFSKLFERTFIYDTKPMEEEGLIEKYPTRPLLITEDLTDIQWKQLAKYANPSTILIDPSVNTPSFIENYIKTSEPVFKKRCITTQDCQTKVIRSDDPEAALRTLQTSTTVFSFYINPDLEISEVIDRATPLNVEAMQAEEVDYSQLAFEHAYKFLLQKLLNPEGETIVLLGLSQNPRLAYELATLFLPHPYLIVNGEIVSIPAKVIVIEPHNTNMFTCGMSSISLDHSEALPLLKQEFPNQEKEFTQLEEIFGLLNALPLPKKKKQYPSQNLPTYAKVKHLISLMQKQPFERVVKDYLLEEYRENKEVYAYLCVCLKLIQPSNGLALNKNAMLSILSTMKRDEQIQDVAWRLLDALSPALAKELFPIGFPTFNLQPESLHALKAILVRYVCGGSWLGVTPEECPLSISLIEEGPIDIQATWNRLLAEAQEGLYNHRLILLQGPPGTGKSFVTTTVIQQMKGKEIARINIGEQTHVSEIEAVLKKALEDPFPGYKFIIGDEATLAKKGFWYFLKNGRYVFLEGQWHEFPENIKFILTSNQNSMKGRKPHSVLLENGKMLFFPGFSDEFMVKNVLKPLLEECFSEQANAIAQEIVKMTHPYAIFLPDDFFTPRDYEHVALQLLYNSAKYGYSSEILIQSIQEVFSFSLTKEQQMAMNIHLKHFVGLKLSNSDCQGNVFRNYASQNHAFVKMIEDLKKKQTDIVFTEPMIELAYHIYLALEIRNERLFGMFTGDRYQKKGKFAFAIEGVSGRGKDTLLELMLQEYGFVDGLSSTQTATGKYQKFYHYTADISLSAEKLLQDLKNNPSSINVLSEANLMKTQDLEHCNNLLSGDDVNPGQLFFITMNSTDYANREILSPAFKNRHIYNSMPDFSYYEFALIAKTFFGRVSPEAVNKLLAYHFALKNRFKGKETTHAPAARQIFFALKFLTEGYSLESVLQVIYLIQHKVLKVSSIVPPPQNSAMSPSNGNNIDYTAFGLHLSQLACGDSSLSKVLVKSEEALLKFSRKQYSSEFLQKLEELRAKYHLLGQESLKAFQLPWRPKFDWNEPCDATLKRYLVEFDTQQLAQELFIQRLKGDLTEGQLFAWGQIAITLAHEAFEAVLFAQMESEHFIRELFTDTSTDEWVIREQNEKAQRVLVGIEKSLKQLPRYKWTGPKASKPEVQVTQAIQTGKTLTKPFSLHLMPGETERALKQGAGKSTYTGEEPFLATQRHDVDPEGNFVPSTLDYHLQQRAVLPQKKVQRITLSDAKSFHMADGFHHYTLLLPECARATNVTVHSMGVTETQLLQTPSGFTLAVQFKTIPASVDITYDCELLDPKLSEDECHTIYTNHASSPLELSLPNDLQALIKELDIPFLKTYADKKAAVQRIADWFQTKLIYSCAPQVEQEYAKATGVKHGAEVLFKTRRGVCRYCNAVFGYVIKSLFDVPVQFVTGHQVKNHKIQDIPHCRTGVLLDPSHTQWDYFDATAKQLDAYTKNVVNKAQPLPKVPKNNVASFEKKQDIERIMVSNQDLRFPAPPNASTFLTDLKSEKIYNDIKSLFFDEWHHKSLGFKQAVTNRPGDWDLNAFFRDPINCWNNREVDKSNLKRRVFVLNLIHEMNPIENPENHSLKAFWQCFFDHRVPLHLFYDDNQYAQLLEVRTMRAFVRVCKLLMTRKQSIDFAETQKRQQLKNNLLQLVQQNKWTYLNNDQQSFWLARLQAISCDALSIKNVSKATHSPEAVSLQTFTKTIKCGEENFVLPSAKEITLIRREEDSYADGKYLSQMNFDHFVDSLKKADLKNTKSFQCIIESRNDILHGGQSSSDMLERFVELFQQENLHFEKLRLDVAWINKQTVHSLFSTLATCTDYLSLGFEVYLKSSRCVTDLRVHEIIDTYYSDYYDYSGIDVDKDMLKDSNDNIKRYTEVYKEFSTMESLKALSIRMPFYSPRQEKGIWNQGIDIGFGDVNSPEIEKLFAAFAGLRVSKLQMSYPLCRVNYHIENALRTGLINLKELCITGCFDVNDNVEELQNIIERTRPGLKYEIRCGQTWDKNYPTRVVSN